MERQKIIKFLSDPKSYPFPVKKVQHIQTYISDVFLTGKFAYKIKKLVNYGYLDFATLAKRKFFINQELKLNRRLSPEMYLDVLPLTEKKGQLKLGGRGRVVEYVLKMKEIPQQYLMNRLIKKNKVSKKTINQLAKIISIFHQKAKTSKKISFFGSLKIIKKNWQENFDQTKSFIGKTISLKDWQFIKKSVEGFINQNKELFQQRIRERKIKDCHGDLHAGNIFVTPKKTCPTPLKREKPIKPYLSYKRCGVNVFDCLEFNDRFRYQDIVSEIAFFAMELDFIGKKPLSIFFIDRYFKLTKDKKLINLLLFYKCYRAYIRGKVLGFSLEQKDLNDQQKNIKKRKAQKYFQLAKKYIKEMQKLTSNSDESVHSDVPIRQGYSDTAVQMLIMGAGLPGIGRSTRLKLLAQKIKAVVLDSDIIRQQIKKIKYDEKSKLMVYHKMINLAEKYLKQGKTVILDATFSKKKYQTLAKKLAQKTKSQYHLIEFYCSDKTAKERLFQRAKEKKPVSQADWSIYQKIKKEWQPIKKEWQPIKNESSYFRINTAQLPEQCVKKIIEKIKL